MVYLILKDLISEQELFGGQSSPKFDDFEEFSTQKLSTMEGWYVLSNNNYYNTIIALTWYNYTTCMQKKYDYFDLTNCMIARIHLFIDKSLLQGYGEVQGAIQKSFRY